MKPFNYSSTLGEMMKNPLASDTLNRFLFSKGITYDLLNDNRLKKMTLGTLQKMCSPIVDKKLFDSFLMMFNKFDVNRLPDSDTVVSESWWKEAVVYQIYPRSFYDSNGDGIGDLEGIRLKIPYLKSLGVNTVWLSPIYDSPNDDNGYDIRDYKKIMSEFGDMEDFDRLLAELHANDIHLIMDLVVNHTSDEHPWFKGALAGDKNLQDYYIFANRKNNWDSIFGGSAFTYYDEVKKYALHLFSKKQMDLNWSNPYLRNEVYDIVNYWLDKGIDGFRMDVINLIAKDMTLPDGDENIKTIGGVVGCEHYIANPKVHDYLQELREKTFDKYGNRVTIGETPGLGYEQVKLWTASERKELDMVFNFDHLYSPGTEKFKSRPYDLLYLKKYFLRWQKLPNSCHNSLFYDNHDNPRLLQRIKPTKTHKNHVAKLLAVILLTLKGTPFIYQGQEIGMAGGEFSKMEDIKDVESHTLYHIFRKKDGEATAFERIANGTRDNARTPMQWNDDIYAGFTQGIPWLGTPDYIGEYNVESQKSDEQSILAAYGKLIKLRRKHKALSYGVFKPVFVKEKALFCYFRIYKGEKFYVECNMTAKRVSRPNEIMNLECVYGSYGDYTSMLRPYEANVYRVK